MSAEKKKKKKKKERTIRKSSEFPVPWNRRRAALKFANGNGIIVHIDETNAEPHKFSVTTHHGVVPAKKCADSASRRATCARGWQNKCAKS